MKSVAIYTDGACSKNPGPGGWAAVLIYGETEKSIFGAVSDSTNNRMELMAAIQGLCALKQPCSVELYTDSAYLCNAFSKGWLDNWSRNGWKTASKSDVENQDLWKSLLQLTKQHEVHFHKVKGHANNVYNNRCDVMARTAIKTLLKSESTEIQP